MPSAQNWLLLLTYAGTCYQGWQVQPNSPTILDILEQAIKRLTGESVKVHGAGRTDSGVHALNFTANFKISTENFKTPSSSKPILVKLSDEDKRLHEDILKKINKPIWG